MQPLHRFFTPATKGARRHRAAALVLGPAALLLGRRRLAPTPGFTLACKTRPLVGEFLALCGELGRLDQVARHHDRRAAERKARTHRLVEIGAILEQATGLTFDTEDSRRALSTALNEQLYYSNGVAFTRGGDIASACGEPDGNQR